MWLMRNPGNIYFYSCWWCLIMWFTFIFHHFSCPYLGCGVVGVVAFTLTVSKMAFTMQVSFWNTGQVRKKSSDVYSHFKTHSTADNKLTLKGYCHKFLESQVTFLSFSFHRSLIAVTRKNDFRFAQILQVLPAFEEFI